MVLHFGVLLKRHTGVSQEREHGLSLRRNLEHPALIPHTEIQSGLTKLKQTVSFHLIYITAYLPSIYTLR